MKFLIVLILTMSSYAETLKDINLFIKDLN